MRWLSLKGTFGLYKISEYGDILRVDKGTLLKHLIMTGHGYYYVDISVRGKKIRQVIHRSVARHFLGEKKDGVVINHIDGNKLNNHYSNLEYCTPSENILHAYRLGLKSAKGSNNGRSKLTEDAVLDIRKSDEPTYVLAKRYNVSCTAIQDVKAKRRWAHV